MKKTFFIVSAVLAAAVLPSCKKEDSPSVSEIRFKVHDTDISTKVSAVTELNSFNVLATTGSAGSETRKWDAVATKSGSSYGTQKYWPATNPSYHFYASNAAITFAQAGATVQANGSSDLVCAYLETSTHNAPNTLNFIHPQARVGSVTTSVGNGYTVSGVSMYLANVKESGKYNIRTAEWSDCANTEKITLASGSNDKYLVPGSYVMYVTYTLTKGDYSGTFTKNGTIQLSQGKINNITVTFANDPAVSVGFNVSVTPWEAKPVSLTLS